MRWNANANPAVIILQGSHCLSTFNKVSLAPTTQATAVCVYFTVASVSDLWNSLHLNRQAGTHKLTRASKHIHFLNVCVCVLADVRFSVGSCCRSGGVWLLFRHVRVRLGAGSTVLHLAWMVVPFCRPERQVGRYCTVCGGMGLFIHFVFKKSKELWKISLKNVTACALYILGHCWLKKNGQMIIHYKYCRFITSQSF